MREGWEPSNRCCYFYHPSPYKNVSHYCLVLCCLSLSLSLSLLGISKAVSWIRSLVASLLIRKTGFDARTVHVRFEVDKRCCDRVFSEYFHFLLSASFHKCSELTYNFGLHLSEGNAGVVLRSLKRSIAFPNIRENNSVKYYHTAFIVKVLEAKDIQLPHIHLR